MPHWSSAEPQSLGRLFLLHFRFFHGILQFVGPTDSITRVEIPTMQAVRVVDYILKHVDACTNSSGKLKHKSKTSPPRCQYISKYKIRET